MSELIEEVWKDVVGYEGRYEVSNFGRVKSLENVINQSRGIRVRKECFLKGSPNSVSGHIRVNLRKDGKTKTKHIHALVLTSFIGDCPTNMEGCHDDGDTNNNYLTNLRWDTRRGNMKDRRLHGTLIRGEMTINSKLTNMQAASIKERMLSGLEKGCDVAKEFGVSKGTISNIKSGKRWAHV
jgi:hypothetical protein